MEYEETEAPGLEQIYNVSVHFVLMRYLIKNTFACVNVLMKFLDANRTEENPFPLWIHNFHYSLDETDNKKLDHLKKLFRLIKTLLELKKNLFYDNSVRILASKLWDNTIL